MPHDGMACECGTPFVDGAGCDSVYHEVLAAEHLDLTLGRWHAVVVCAYVLQHPSQGVESFLDGQFRILQLYRDKGLDALRVFASHQRARNRHDVQAGYELAPLKPYTPLPAGTCPARFEHGFQDLRHLVGAFDRDGHRDYERRLNWIVDATVTAYLDADAGGGLCPMV